MDGIALLGVFIAIAMLLRWLVVHDKAPNQKTLGLFAMREPGDVPANQTLTTSRRDSRISPQPAQPGISITPPSRIQK